MNKNNLLIRLNNLYKKRMQNVSQAMTAVAQWYFPITLSFLAIDLMSSVFANDSGDRGSVPGRVIPKTQKKLLDAVLHNVQHYKNGSRGK